MRIGEVEEFSQEEVDQWAARDPIARFRSYLEGLGLWTRRHEERIAAKAARLRTELRDAVFDGVIAVVERAA